MNASYILRLFSALTCLALWSCSSTKDDTTTGSEFGTALITGINVSGYTTVEVRFAEALDPTATVDVSKYSILPARPSGIAVTSVAVDALDASRVLLTLNKAALPISYVVKVNNVTNARGDVLASELRVKFTGASKVAFITQAFGNGKLSSWPGYNGEAPLDFADKTCQTEANNAGLKGTFKAYLSTSTVNAKDRIGTDSALWLRTDAMPLALTTGDLMAGKSVVPFWLDSYGDNLFSNPDYSQLVAGVAATGSNLDGSKKEGKLCGDWTSSDESMPLGAGNPVFVRSGWNASVEPNCSNLVRLYCFQTDAGPTGTPPYKTEGKVVFISSQKVPATFGATANGALVEADTICQARAAAARLTNSARFKAWISTSTTDAKSRLTSNGPWVQLNGIKVADNLADLIDGTVFSGIYINELGAPPPTGESPVAWTGTSPFGEKTGATCGNWTSTTEGIPVIGIGDFAHSFWTGFAFPFIPCAATFALYCFED